MKTYAHGLNKCTVTGRYALCRYYFLPWQYHEVTHCTVTLHTQCLVELACIGMSGTASGTVTAVGIGIYRYGKTRNQIIRYAGAHTLYHGTYLMTRNNCLLGHQVASQECIKVRSAETYIVNFKKHLTCTCGGLGCLLHNHLSLCGNPNLSHQSITLCPLQPYHAQTAKQIRGIIYAILGLAIDFWT